MSVAPVLSERRLRPLLNGVAAVADADDCVIASLAVDSRVVVPGSLFFAMPGATTDGRDHIAAALARGAAAVAYEHWPDGRRASASRRCFAVAGLRPKVGTVARRFYGAPAARLTVVGVTGTNGKTTCTHLLAQALTRLGTPAAVLGTLGSGLVDQLRAGALTTPDAIAVHASFARLLDDGAAAVCMEVSSHGLDQGRVNGVDFEAAVFTNLTRDHLDYHGDMARYGETKARLFRWPGLQHAVVNVADPFGQHLAGAIESAALMTYGAGGQVTVRRIDALADGLALELATPLGQIAFRTDLFGIVNAENLMAVVATLIALGRARAEIETVMTGLAPVPGRMERFHGTAGPQVVVDFAHTPDALRQALESLAGHTRGALWVVFGCGGERDRGKRPQMGAIAEQLADRVVLTDDNPRGEVPEHIIGEIAAGMSTVPDIRRGRGAAIAWAIGAADRADIVLVAGKGHETTETIGTEVRRFSDRAFVCRQLGIDR